MTRSSSADREPIDAGGFSTWLGQIGSAVRDGSDSVVPCGSCSACCSSSQFIHIAPDEIAALDAIPGDLLFAAPGLPAGHKLMGYDDHGRCPMLVDGACTIYASRPRTCRTYDCRVFAAAGVVDADDAKVEVARRVDRWRFTYSDRFDRLRHEAVRAAARRLEMDADLPPDLRPSSPGQLALLALAVHESFLREDPGGELQLVDPDQSTVNAAVKQASG